MPFLEQPLPDRGPHSGLKSSQKRVRHKKNEQCPNLSNDERSTTPNELQPAELCGRDDHHERDQERCEEQLTALPQEEASGQTGKGMKRAAEENGDEVSVAKSVCLEQMRKPELESHERCLPSSESTDPTSEAPVVETEEAISLTNVEDSLQRKEQEGETVCSEIKFAEADQSKERQEHLTDEKMESSGSEIMNVEGNSDRSVDLTREDGCRALAKKICRTAQFVKVKPPPSKEVHLGSTGSWEEDEDIDIIGGSSPPPDPVIITWAESSSSEDEELGEEIDIMEEKTDCTS